MMRVVDCQLINLSLSAPCYHKINGRHPECLGSDLHRSTDEDLRRRYDLDDSQVSEVRTRLAERKVGTTRWGG